VVGAQGKRAPRHIVHIHERALTAAGPGERQQIGSDASDAGCFVVHHLQHLAVLRLQFVQQQRLREPGDDRRRVVDLVGHTAHELAHGRELLRLLELGLVALLLGDVAREDQDSRDPAAFADRGVQQGRDPVGSVVARERRFEPLDLPVERRRQLVPDDRRRVGGQELEDAAVYRGRDQRAHDVGGPVGFEDTPLTIDDHDRIGDGLHEQPQIALRGAGGGERVHQRPGLARDFVLEQRRVAPVGAGGMEQPHADDHDGQGDEHGTARVGLGGQRAPDRNRSDATQPDHEGRDARGVARNAARPRLQGLRGGRRHRRGGGEQQQARVPPEIQHASHVEGPPQRGRGVHDVREAQDPQGDDDARRSQGNAREAQQLHQDQP